MKLFYKFLLALLLATIIPLSAYFIMLVKTTGKTLENVINENSVSFAKDMAAPVDKLMADLETTLDIGRKVEQLPDMTEGRKNQMLIEEIGSKKYLLGLFLLDEYFNAKNSIVADNQSFAFTPNNTITDRVFKSKQVEIGELSQEGSDLRYFDIIYPVDSQPREYLYVRVNLKYLTDRLSGVLEKKGASSRFVTMIDNENRSVSTAADGVRELNDGELPALEAQGLEKVFIKDDNLSVLLKTGGPQWTLLYQQPVAEAYSPVRKLKTDLLTLALLILGFSVFGAYVLARNLTKNIGVVMAGIEHVGKGNLDYKMPQVSSDELNSLRSKFNEMTVKLKNLQEEMKTAERMSVIGKISVILGNEFREIFNKLQDAIYFVKMELHKIVVVDSHSTMPLYMHKIEDAFIVMDKLTKNMVYYAGSAVPVFVRQDVGELIRTVLDTAPIPEKITARIELNKTPEAVMDKEEVAQAIMNVIENAVDGMADTPAGVMTIRTVEDAARERVVIEILDTGMGIPNENLEKVTDPFFTTKSRATGLGLAVVKKIIESRHKGKLVITSQKGAGTVVRMEIPTN